MIKELEDILYDSSGLTAEQNAINDAEWRKAENWSGWLCPSYSSAVDSRPFVPIAKTPMENTLGHSAARLIGNDPMC